MTPGRLADRGIISTQRKECEPLAYKVRLAFATTFYRRARDAALGRVGGQPQPRTCRCMAHKGSPKDIQSTIVVTLAAKA